MLVAACVRDATLLGIPALHLYTPDRASLYERFGWETIGTETVDGEHVRIMRLLFPSRGTEGPQVTIASARSRSVTSHSSVRRRNSRCFASAVNMWPAFSTTLYLTFPREQNALASAQTRRRARPNLGRLRSTAGTARFRDPRGRESLLYFLRRGLLLRLSTRFRWSFDFNTPSSSR